LWPTPNASLNGYDADPERWEARRESLAQKYGNNGMGMPLGIAARLWPTPTSRDHKDGRYCPNVPLNGLLGRVVWATPQARDFRTGQKEGWDNPARSRNLNDQMGGKLSVIFVEWLMGYPAGWTACEVSATRSSRNAPIKSSRPSRKRKSA
jgi:hypothetical protein